MRWRAIGAVSTLGLMLVLGVLLRTVGAGASGVQASDVSSMPTSEPTAAVPTLGPAAIATMTVECRPAPAALICSANDGETAQAVWRWPIHNRRITQRYGAAHSGWDLSGQIGQAIFAAALGKVTYAGWNDSGYGNLVIVDHGNGLQTWYAHLQYIVVTVGQAVNAGDQLGTMGASGNADGWHLHFEVRVNGVPQDPERYLVAEGRP
jgi:septal ring factor EnvC (AmiA/AmiB activator)